jgi:hypothetical protein
LEKLKSELYDDLKQSLNSPENHLSIEELDALLEDVVSELEKNFLATPVCCRQEFH